MWAHAATRAGGDFTIQSQDTQRVAATPQTKKIGPKPRMNRMDFPIPRRIRFACGVLSSSTPTPEIIETYPGTRGSTQGERKETRPARNAAIMEGFGRFDIDFNCTCCGPTLQNQTRGSGLSCRMCRGRSCSNCEPRRSHPSAKNAEERGSLICCVVSERRSNAIELVALKPDQPWA